MTTVTKPCRSCGSAVTRGLVPAELPLAAAMNDLPHWCEPCLISEEKAAAIEEDRVQARAAAERIAERIKESGLPAAHHELTLSSLDHPSKVIDAARQWAAFGGGLMLTGEVGVGKTAIAGAAALARLRSRPMFWTSAPLLFARLGSGFGSEQRDWALNLLSGRRALVLDDIDKARPTEYAAEQVFLAIDQRVEHLAPLMTTSNLTASQLADRWPEPYGPALSSRLVGYCKTIYITGPDRRLGSR